ncbi:DNA repair protein [Roseobacter sp.]|uniref:DNA repair protein n=1 Tax=Roseobacter sp. TaxID=1907202 RepID=UPI003299351C
MDRMSYALLKTRTAFQSATLALVSLMAIAMASYTALAAFGVVPWLELPVSINGTLLEQGGLYGQVLITGVLVSMCFFLPTNHRVMQLEAAHHRFSIRMEDVAHAYAVVHAKDRTGAFQMSSEFDAVKERMLHLRTHPDLGGLEPDVMEIAAQMSRVSQDLAQTYSDDRMDRAYDFLRQRQHEVDGFQDRLDHAKALHSDIRQWASRLDMDETIAQSQLNRMIDDLHDVLPELDQTRADDLTRHNPRQGVLHLPGIAAE